MSTGLIRAGLYFRRINLTALLRMDCSRTKVDAVTLVRRFLQQSSQEDVDLTKEVAVEVMRCWALTFSLCVLHILYQNTSKGISNSLSDILCAPSPPNQESDLCLSVFLRLNLILLK